MKAKVTEILNKVEGVDAIEINISCTNVKGEGMYFGVNPDATFKVVKAVSNATDLTVIPKLTPSVSDITVLQHAYTFFRAIEQAFAFLDQTRDVILQPYSPFVGAVARHLGTTDPTVEPSNVLIQRYRRYSTTVRALFTRLMTNTRP